MQLPISLLLIWRALQLYCAHAVNLIKRPLAWTIGDLLSRRFWRKTCHGSQSYLIKLVSFLGTHVISLTRATASLIWWRCAGEKDKAPPSMTTPIHIASSKCSMDNLWRPCSPGPATQKTRLLCKNCRVRLTTRTNVHTYVVSGVMFCCCCFLLFLFGFKDLWRRRNVEAVKRICSCFSIHEKSRPRTWAVDSPAIPRRAGDNLSHFYSPHSTILVQ